MYFTNSGIPISITISSPFAPKFGSCLTLRVEEDIPCKETSCNNPIVAFKKFDNPRFKQNNLTVKLNMPEDRESGRFVVKAVLHDGWCASRDDEPLRSGDHHNAKRLAFELRDGMDEVNDLEVQLKKGKPTIRMCCVTSTFI